MTDLRRSHGPASRLRSTAPVPEVADPLAQDPAIPWNGLPDVLQGAKEGLPGRRHPGVLLVRLPPPSAAEA
jgi:hypothetical protein